MVSEPNGTIGEPWADSLDYDFVSSSHHQRGRALRIPSHHLHSIKPAKLVVGSGAALGPSHGSDPLI
jgi:hypothetical protein